MWRFMPTLCFLTLHPVLLYNGGICESMFPDNHLRPNINHLRHSSKIPGKL